MSTWSDAPARGTVLRGGAASVARPARMDSELRSTPFAPLGAVDARLTDPHLVGVVDTARRAAAEQGRLDGHAEGYAAGMALAAADAAVAAAGAARRLEQDAQEQRTRTADAVRVLTAASQAFLQQEQVAVVDVENAVVTLALDLARAVLDREIATTTNPGADAIARALVLAPEGGTATVYLHPADVVVLGEVDGLGRLLVLVADPSVERGGCVLESGGRRVDAQLGPALDRVAAVLR